MKIVDTKAIAGRRRRTYTLNSSGRSWRPAGAKALRWPASRFLTGMNGHDPYVYLKDVLTRLPTHKASRIGELLPHRWQATTASA